MTFLLSSLALVLGPFIYALGKRQPSARQILDGFIFITIAGIVAVHIIPDAIAIGGTLAIVFLVLGLGFPVVVERLFERSLERAHILILVLAAIGLLLHATIDGIALLVVSPEGEAYTLSATLGGVFAGRDLALGVILHRLPVGMAIWWSLRPSFGSGVAIATFALIIIATGAAYFLGAPLIELAETRGVAYVQAFVAGSLVHIVAFGVSHDHDHSIEHIEPAPQGREWGYRVGILLGMFLVFSLPHLPGHAE